MTLVQTELKSLKIWTTDVKKVYVWRNGTEIQVRPTSTPRLPSAYQEVEYIEGTWTAYLIIWNYLNTSYIMEAKYQLPYSWATITLWCNRWSRVPYRRYWLISDGNVTNVIVWWSSWTNLWTPWTAVHTLKIQGSTAYYDWVAYSVSYSANLWINYWLWVFIYNNPSLPSSADAWWRVFYLKISDSDSTSLYDLVPCYRKSDGEIWMYDLVTNTFFTNQGTGTFTKWPDVN